MITKNQLQKVRTSIRQNRTYIDNTLKQTELEANTFLFESGCQFLEKTFGHSPSYLKHSRSVAYWKWYRLQFYGVESSFVHYLKRTNKKRPEGMLMSQYQGWVEFYCITSNRIDQAFKNYLNVSK